MKIYTEYCLKRCLWKDWSLPGLITSLSDKRSIWGKSWISVWGHISYGENKEQHTVHLAENSVQNFYTVFNTAKYHFLKIWSNHKQKRLNRNMSVTPTPLGQPRFIFVDNFILIVSSLFVNNLTQLNGIFVPLIFITGVSVLQVSHIVRAQRGWMTLLSTSLRRLIHTGTTGMMNTEQSPQNFPTTKVKVLPLVLTLLGLATLNNIPINNFVIE